MHRKAAIRADRARHGSLAGRRILRRDAWSEQDRTTCPPLPSSTEPLSLAHLVASAVPDELIGLETAAVIKDRADISRGIPMGRHPSDQKETRRNSPLAVLERAEVPTQLIIRVREHVGQWFHDFRIEVRIEIIRSGIKQQPPLSQRWTVEGDEEAHHKPQ